MTIFLKTIVSNKYLPLIDWMVRNHNVTTETNVTDKGESRDVQRFRDESHFTKHFNKITP